MAEKKTEEKKEKKQIPIVPYLKLPESTSEKAQLTGTKCRTCGSAFLGSRSVCPNCSTADNFEEMAFSTTGEIHTWTIVHQSAPGVPAPFIAGIVDLPEGVSVRCNITGIEPEPENVKFGMKVEMVLEKVHEDKEGNEIIAYKFKPV